ncbi:hypothetical protein C943_00907 [Mariniradius saccharolyticus AK6]|uniref:Uncharacterized protein n=1 Tax=Mariniradius saccharolyticus AK6 TaxID=1239962 RepID=M7X653_9BACT|nr:hypothetical protein C943_00907 [Mariniradius saccharolyticus AK6]
MKIFNPDIFAFPQKLIAVFRSKAQKRPFSENWERKKLL